MVLPPLRTYCNMKENYTRALMFLDLAIEQLRFFDPEKADFLRKTHLNQLSEFFKDAVAQIEQIHPDEDKRGRYQVLEVAGRQMIDHVVQALPPAPPGLGFGVLPEVLPTKLRNTVSSTSDRSGTAADSTYGTEFDLTPRPGQSSTSKNERPLMSALLDDSDPLDPCTAHNFLAAIARPTHQPRSQVADVLDEMHATQGPESGNESNSGRSKSVNSLQEVAESAAKRNSPSKPPVRQPKSNVVSWADVAAIPSEKAEIQKPFNGHLNGVSNPIAVQRSSSAKTAIKLPIEPLSDQRRVVWITNLPPTYTSYNISSKIDQGPLMSILIEDNVSEDLPGRSACVIFQHASHASSFIAANEAHAAQVLSTTSPPTSSQDSSDRLTKPTTNTLYALTAPHATLLSGAIFPADKDLSLMDAPTLARRRLKWSRSRLFYDVSLYRFKADLYKVAGKANVELVHFYNPGEATVVFSSVRVANVVKGKWEAWSESYASTRRPSAGNKYAGKGNGEELQVILKPGKHPLDPMRGADPKELYKGTDVSFVHDFNEVPVRLVSQYGSDGRVRKCSGGKGGLTDGGVEGIFAGPDVP